jgi:membrane-bound lytic murein transglycosylase MltF
VSFVASSSSAKLINTLSLNAPLEEVKAPPSCLSAVLPGPSVQDPPSSSCRNAIRIQSMVVRLSLVQPRPEDRSLMRRWSQLLSLSFGAVCLVLVIVACNSSSPPPAPDGAPAAAPASDPSAAAAPAEDALPPVPSPYDALPETVRANLAPPFTGDLDQMTARRLIRAGVVFNRTQYFIDRGTQRGFAYESIRLFEEQLNKRLKKGELPVHVAFVPLSRDQLFPALVDGKVDLIAAALTITPERQKVASFSNPTRLNVSEIVVTGKDAPSMATPGELSGREVFVRRSSSYYESLLRLNTELKAAGKPPATIKEAPEVLEDDDLLEMVNAGLVETTVVDDFVAQFWQQVFPNLHLHRQAALRTGGSIAVAVRMENPGMLRAVNTWINEYGPRTTFGNVMEKRYLQDAGYAKNATSEAERKKFEALVSLFRKYSDRYELDYILMAAQGYQESRLDHNARSKVGAVGVMQVMPATGKDLNVGNIMELEPNIHAGIKYFRFMMDEYYKDDDTDALNKGLMTLASYNAGPARVRQLRREAEKRGLNPNVWFGNVERIASERIGRETVQYVSNIYKYYVAYRLTIEQRDERRRLKARQGQ